MVNNIIEILKNGGVGVIPTETVLGLCGKFDSKEAIKKIYKLKDRPIEKKLSIIFENYSQIEKNFDINLPYNFKKLAFYFWPGPLTIIISDNLGNKIGFRKPKNETTLFLLSKLDFPLVCTSVNISSKLPAIKISQIDQQIKKQLDFLIEMDADDLKSSTVYDLEEDTILRMGPISHQQILDVINDK